MYVTLKVLLVSLAVYIAICGICKFEFEFEFLDSALEPNYFWRSPCFLHDKGASFPWTFEGRWRRAGLTNNLWLIERWKAFKKIWNFRILTFKLGELKQRIGWFFDLLWLEWFALMPQTKYVWIFFGIKLSGTYCIVELGGWFGLYFLPLHWGSKDSDSLLLFFFVFIITITSFIVDAFRN